MAIKLLPTCFAVLMLVNVSAVGAKFYDSVLEDRLDEEQARRDQMRRHQCADKETKWISEESSDPSSYWKGWLDVGCLAQGFQCRDSYCDDVKLIGGCCLGVWDIDWYWTEFFSEEKKAPVLCKRDYFVAGIRCEGSYCDNISLFCTKLKNNDEGGKYTWDDCSSSPSAWISEEKSGTYRVQKDGYYIVGVECSGAYCDNKRFYTCRLLLLSAAYQAKHP